MPYCSCSKRSTYSSGRTELFPTETSALASFISSAVFVVASPPNSKSKATSGISGKRLPLLMDNPSPATLPYSTPPDESPIPSSSFKKAVSLTDWWLVKAEQEYNGMRLAVGGIEMKRQQATRVFRSSPIVKRHSTFILETADGATVIVWGIINKQRTHENGFPPEANERFLLGFPYNWEVYANLYCGEGSGTQNAPADSSFIAGLPVPSVNCAQSARIPMRRLLEYLISTRGPNDTSEFANVDRNCASQALRNPTVLDLHMEAAYNGRNDVQAAYNGRNDVQEAYSPKEVNQLVAAYNGRNAVQSKKICVSKGSRSVLVRRLINISNCVVNNNEGEQTPEESVNNEKNEVGMMSKPEADSFSPEIRKVGFISTEGNDAYIEHSEPVKSLFSGEGRCNSVKKTSRQVNKSNESSPVSEEETHTARVSQQNSGCRISKSRLKKSMKNLREDRVIKGNLEMEQKVSSSMLEKSDIVSDVRITVEHISHGIHVDVAEDTLEEVMYAETPKNNDRTFIQCGFQVDEQSSHDIVCDKKESSISSIERGEAELGSNSNNSMTMQRSGDTVKGNIGRRKKSTSVNRHMLMRSSAKKLGVVLPESLNCKRSRSGRLLVPALASWRNEQPVYDLDGGIIGIAVGFNEKAPSTGGKYR